MDMAMVATFKARRGQFDFEFHSDGRVLRGDALCDKVRDLWVAADQYFSLCALSCVDETHMSYMSYTER